VGDATQPFWTRDASVHWPFPYLCGAPLPDSDGNAAFASRRRHDSPADIQHRARCSKAVAKCIRRSANRQLARCYRYARLHRPPRRSSRAIPPNGEISGMRASSVQPRDLGIFFPLVEKGLNRASSLSPTALLRLRLTDGARRCHRRVIQLLQKSPIIRCAVRALRKKRRVFYVYVR